MWRARRPVGLRFATQAAKEARWRGGAMLGAAARRSGSARDDTAATQWAAAFLFVVFLPGREPRESTVTRPESLPQISASEPD